MMDAGEVVSDRQLLSDFIRSFMELTAANIDAQTKALERLRALAEPAFYEYDAAARCVQRDDEVFHGGEWRRVEESKRCGAYAWHLKFADDGWPLFVCCDRGDSVRVRRPRGERAA